MFLAAVGLSTGNPYCAAFVSWVLDQQIAPAVSFPKIRTARAQSFITSSSIKASEVLRGTKVPEDGDILIWKKGNTVFGHTGFVETWGVKLDGTASPNCGITIEANTSSGIYGDQRDGDGVFRRERCIEPGNYFRIVSFTPVDYKTE